MTEAQKLGRRRAHARALGSDLIDPPIASIKPSPERRASASPIMTASDFATEPASLKGSSPSR